METFSWRHFPHLEVFLSYTNQADKASSQGDPEGLNELMFWNRVLGPQGKIQAMPPGAVVLHVHQSCMMNLYLPLAWLEIKWLVKYFQIQFFYTSWQLIYLCYFSRENTLWIKLKDHNMQSIIPKYPSMAWKIYPFTRQWCKYSTFVNLSLCLFSP